MRNEDDRDDTQPRLSLRQLPAYSHTEQEERSHHHGRAPRGKTRSMWKAAAFHEPASKGTPSRSMSASLLRHLPWQLHRRTRAGLPYTTSAKGSVGPRHALQRKGQRLPVRTTAGTTLTSRTPLDTGERRLRGQHRAGRQHMCRHLCSALHATRNKTVSEDGAHGMTSVLRPAQIA